MKASGVRIRKRLALPLPGTFGLYFEKDHPDLIVGVAVKFTNARYLVTSKKKAGTGYEVAFALDHSSRAQRKGRPPERTLKTNTQFDRLRQEAAEEKE